MKMFSKTKVTKKFILILVLLLLFDFIYPKNVHAMLGMDDLEALPARILYMLEEGILSFTNDIFTRKELNTKKLDKDFNTESGNFQTKELKIYLTPENIIKGKFLLLDANIFKEVKGSVGEYYDYEDNGSVKTGREKLRDIIAGWYYALRNLAIVVLLSVLVYVGIRMIMSTVAQDKAKYKVMFKDWLVALCLLFVMHYMMIGILNITTMMTKALGGGKNSNMIGNLTRDITGILSEGYDEQGTLNKSYKMVKLDGQGNVVTDGNGNQIVMTLGDAYAKILVLGGIIIYTFIFAIKYLKREFTIIFLILLGPVSCITYPIDKISDGKAQAFNKWFSEFLYQIIIQPFHLLLYIVLVGSAVELADTNIIYALVCFAVMIPAEKFIKEMFGFRDKLGSPLGGFAGGAIASQLFNKMKGGGSGKVEKGENNSVPRELPPKTTDNAGLVEGEMENNENDSIGGGNNLGLDGGEEPGGGASAGAAYQNSDDPVSDAERASLEEQIADGQLDEDELTEEQRKLLGKDDENLDEQSDNSVESNNIENTDDTETQNKLSRILNSKPIGTIRSVHNQRMAKKWGSASRGQRWINRGKKIGKIAGRAALVGAGAATVGAFGAMFGNGKKGLLAGAALGSLGFQKAEGAVKNITNTGKDYANALNTPEKREKRGLKDFKSDRKQIDKAVYSYRKNNNGEDPSRKQLEKEMEDRFELSRYGLKDDQIDDVLPLYQDKVESLLNDGKSEAEAKEIAASQAKYTANLAKAYSAKDFRDPKTMENAYNKIKDGLIAKTGCNSAIADRYARKYLTDAGKINSVDSVALPTKTIDVPVSRNRLNLDDALGISGSTVTDEQRARISTLKVRLREQGYSDSDMKRIASMSADSRMSTEGVINKFEAEVEYLSDGRAQEQAKQLIEVMNNGRNATAEQVKREMQERLIIKDTFNVSNEKDISAIRDLERTELKGKTQVQAARDFARENRGQLDNSAHMATAKQNLINKLKAGGSSTAKATKDAENIINLADQYSNKQ